MKTSNTNDEDFGHLRKSVERIQPLDESLWQTFASVWEPVHFKRKELMTATGQIERYAYFVLEGVQRSYYIGEDGREATLVFTYPYSYSGVADSFLLQEPSRYSLETLTGSRFLRSAYPALSALMDAHHAIERFIRLLTTRAMSGVLERQVELTCFSAEQKFRALLRRSPHVLQIIPHKYLASYLGIDPATFSKLMGTVRL